MHQKHPQTQRLFTAELEALETESATTETLYAATRSAYESLLALFSRVTDEDDRSELDREACAAYVSRLISLQELQALLDCV